MSSPLIGVTTYRTQHPFKSYGYLSVTEPYISALTEAGAIPVLIPLTLPERSVAELTRTLDGLVFSGGGDIDPGLYDGASHPLVKQIDLERDQMEIDLVHKAVRDDIPFLGICRGIQTINVALGGTLYADIRAQYTNALVHDHDGRDAWQYLAHPVQIQEQSRLADIIGEPILMVNSLHHQAVHHMAPELVAVALAPDGIIEALEVEGHVFGLGVQWHPEWLTEHAGHRSLFTALVEAASVKTK